MSDTARERMLFLAREVGDDLADAFEDMRLDFDRIHGPYKQQITAAAQEAAELLAFAATGEDEAVAELKVVAASLALWTWANAEAQRKATIKALYAWLRRAAQSVGELALEVIEAGVSALVQAGLNELTSD